MARIYLNGKIVFRRDTKVDWGTNNPILADGEIGIVTDGTSSQRIKIGDGTNYWNDLEWVQTADLVYDGDSENAQSGVALKSIFADKQDKFATVNIGTDCELSNLKPISFTSTVKVLTPVASSNPATKKYVDDKSALKVDKVTGKGLSTNDYDAAEKAKVASAVQPADLAGVATSGSYADLTDTPTIDQTYSATSTNAQSGVAVAQAVNGKQDKFATVGDVDENNQHINMLKTYTTLLGEITFNDVVNVNSPEDAINATNKGYVDNLADLKLDTSKVKNANSTTEGDVYDVRYVNSKLDAIFELIETVTFDGTVSSFVRNKTPDNESYNYRALLLRYRKPAIAGSGYAWFTVNGLDLGVQSNRIFVFSQIYTEARKMNVLIRVIGGRIFTNTTSSASSLMSDAPLNVVGNGFGEISADKITGIASAYGTYPNGTTIEIWGMK